MNSPKAKAETYEIVALLGTVRSPISRLVPVVKLPGSDIVIAVGSGLKRAMDESALNELIETGQATKLPNYYPIDTYAPGMRPMVVSKSQSPISLPYYALYIDDSAPGFQDMEETRRSQVLWPQPLVDVNDRRIWVLPNKEVNEFYQAAFEKLADELECLLAVESEGRTKRLQNAEMRTRAEALFKLAYDARSSEQAIAYGAYLRMNNPRESTRWYHWVELACKLWKLESSREHWLSLLQAKSDAIMIRSRETRRDPYIIERRRAYFDPGVPSKQPIQDSERLEMHGLARFADPSLRDRDLFQGSLKLEHGEPTYTEASR